jgi:hypothetical protein
MTRIKKPQRAKCHVCGRRRLAKFLEWHPGLEEWQCKNFEECDRYVSGLIVKKKVWPPSDDWGM